MGGPLPGFNSRRKAASGHQANGKKFYGVQFTATQKAFIVQEEYDTGAFKLITFGREMTMGNSWDTYDNNDLKLMIQNLIVNDKPVFEFDTAKELYQWLGKNHDFES